jgi:hypothetical protein
MRKTFPIRLPGDTEEQVAQRTRRLRLEAGEREERERRASMRLVAKAAARAILQGSGPTREVTVSEARAVRDLTADEIRAAVEAGAMTKALKRKVAAERSAILKSTREVHK